MSTVEGRTVTKVREMSNAEHERMGWIPDNLGVPDVLVLDDGTVLFAVADTEGNHSGAFHKDGSYTDLANFEGAVIERLAPMSDEYMEHLRWGDATGIKPTCVLFEDGRGIYPACDYEGNNYGTLRAYDDTCDEHETYGFEFTPVETDLFENQSRGR
jgi:hypothetical protein